MAPTRFAKGMLSYLTRAGRCLSPSVARGGGCIEQARPVPAPGACLAGAPSAITLIVALPAYQVALWPDGWLLEPDGSVRVRDTHAMAEARRWLTMSARNAQCRVGVPLPEAEVERAMRLHRVFVPRAVIDLAGRRFASEQVASVALTLVAGDWIEERRRALCRTPEQALAARSRAWSGSCHAGAPDAAAAQRLLQALLGHCISERLVPRARYTLASRIDDGYGIRCCQCLVQVNLDSYARARVQEELSAALIPWNRAVIRDGCVVPVITVKVGERRAGRVCGRGRSTRGALPAFRPQDLGL